MKITYYGHACFLLETKGKKVLFDPFISPNSLASHIEVNNIEADYILLSHGHEDHVADAHAIASRNGATIVSNFEIVSWFQQKGLQKTHPMNIGGQWAFDFGTVRSVAAVHSSVLPDGTYGGNPGGFVISNEEGAIYFAGDTALTMDMKLIPLWYPNLKAALLPIGDNFTMGVEDAVIASDFTGCNNIIGMHFDTFGYIRIDHAKAVHTFEQKGKKLVLPEIGETIEL